MSIDREMLLLTPDGYATIADLSGNSATIWDGMQWDRAEIRHVGKERCVRLFLTVTRSYGEAIGKLHYMMTIDLSPSTLIMLADGSERAAFDLQEGDRLAPWADKKGTVYTSVVREQSAMGTEAVDVYRAYPPCDCVINQVLVRFHTVEPGAATAATPATPAS
jgi:hypothetical protein